MKIEDLNLCKVSKLILYALATGALFEFWLWLPSKWPIKDVDKILNIGADPGFCQGVGPALEAESCPYSIMELCKQSKPFAAGVQGH